MTRRAPWARILAEGLVIVASILLAFGIDAWWDRAQERREELGYLVALHSEFEQAAEELARDEATRAERIRVIDHLIGQMKERVRAPQDSLTVWFAGLWYDSPFLPPDAVYRDLLATGGLNTLTSFPTDGG